MSNKKNDLGELWEVFIQSKNGLPYKHVGSVYAHDKEFAIHNARDLYNRRNEGSSIWIVKSSQIVAVDLDTSDYIINNSDDKIYRNPTFYDIPDEIKNL